MLRQFCRDVGLALQHETSDAEGACYHGIGHGITDGSDPGAWGNAQKVIAPGKKICEEITVNDTAQKGFRYRCVTGAYNALEILSQDSKYKLDSLAQDPFAFCAAEPHEYQEGCYSNMLPALLRKTQDFADIAQRIEAINNDADFAIRTWVMLGLFHEYIRLHLSETDYGVSSAVALCKAVVDTLHLSCIEGLAGGHMKYGKPGEEYRQAITFCNNTVLESTEQQICFAHILPRLRIWYSEGKTQEICALVPSQYQHYCKKI